jgi:hypothetical protein
LQKNGERAPGSCPYGARPSAPPKEKTSAALSGGARSYDYLI